VSADGPGKRLVLQLVVGPDGRIKSVKVVGNGLNRGNAQPCLLEKIKGWKLPVPQDGRDTTVTLFLILPGSIAAKSSVENSLLHLTPWKVALFRPLSPGSGEGGPEKFHQAILVSNPSQLHDQGIRVIRAGNMGKVFVFFPGELPSKPKDAPGGKGGNVSRWAERFPIFPVPHHNFFA
jgi:hypothetical protein